MVGLRGRTEISRISRWKILNLFFWFLGAVFYTYSHIANLSYGEVMAFGQNPSKLQTPHHSLEDDMKS